MAKKKPRYTATFWTCGRGDEVRNVCTFSAGTPCEAFQKTLALAKSFVETVKIKPVLREEFDVGEPERDAAYWTEDKVVKYLDGMDFSDYYCVSLVAPDNTILYSGDQTSTNYADFG